MNYKLVILIIFSLGFFVSPLFSPYYKRCRVNHNRVDPDAIPIEDLQVERVPKYYSDYYVQPVMQPQLQVDYQQYDFYFHDFIDAGGSGEVYLIEDMQTGEGKIVKRFFKQKPNQFRRENYIMKKLNYSIWWAKDCGPDKCPPNAQRFNTLALYPYKESIIIRKLQYDPKQAPLIFYKILRELDRAHKAGIIHNDLKMGNIMVNSIGPNFKFYDVQLIDWNLSSFYYTGIDINIKKGTICYYSPQQLFLTNHITPAIDIWALGIVMYTYYSDSKPFTFNCKGSNMKAIVSLVGGKKILQMYKKYRYNNVEYISLLNEIQDNLSQYPQNFMNNIKPKNNRQYFTQDLIQVFRRMFQPDPQNRATPQELMKLSYFKKINELPKMYEYKNMKLGKHGKVSQNTKK